MSLTSERKFGDWKSINLSLNSFDGKSVSAVLIPRNRAPYQPGDFHVELPRSRLLQDSWAPHHPPSAIPQPYSPLGRENLPDAQAGN